MNNITSIRKEPLPASSVNLRQGIPSSPSLLARIAGVFSAAMTQFRNWFANLFAKPSPQTYQFPLARENLVEKARGDYASEDDLETQLRSDWSRGFPVYLGTKRLDTKEFEVACKELQTFLEDNGITDLTEQYKIASCLLPSFIANFQGPLTDALGPKYTPVADNNAAPPRMTLSVKNGIASLEFSCPYQIVDKKTFKPVCKIELTGTIADHTTGIGHCELKVSNPSSLPKDLRAILQLRHHLFQITQPEDRPKQLLSIWAAVHGDPDLLSSSDEEGAPSSEVASRLSTPLFEETVISRFQEDFFQDRTHFTLPSTSRVEKEGTTNSLMSLRGNLTDEQLVDQIYKDLPRMHISVEGHQLTTHPSSERKDISLRLYEMLLELEDVSQEDIEFLKPCLQQGTLGIFTEDLDHFIFVEHAGKYLTAKVEETTPSIEITAKDGKVTIHGTIHRKILDATNPEGPPICTLILKGTIEDHRTGIAVSEVILAEEPFTIDLGELASDSEKKKAEALRAFKADLHAFCTE